MRHRPDTPTRASPFVARALGWALLAQACAAQCPIAALSSPLAPPGAQFGRAVATDGLTVLIGAPTDDMPGALDCGAAYIYSVSGGVWIEVARLIAADLAPGDQFGRSVSVFGDRAVIGAPLDDDQGLDAGSVYVFRRSPEGVWSHEAKLRALESSNGDQFGSAVAYDGSMILAGAPGHDKNGFDSGAAYLFAIGANSQWGQERQLLAPDGLPGDQYGAAVAAWNQRFVIGAPRHFLWGPTSGAAYFGRRIVPTVIAYEGKVWPNDGATGDEFGSAVAIRADLALIGAPFDDFGATNTGSAYVFQRNPMFAVPWIQQNKFLSPTAAAQDRFGAAVALGANAALIGAGLAGADDSGRARVFLRRESGLWQTWSLLGDAAPQPGALFGAAVAAEGDFAVIGARAGDLPADGQPVGWALLTSIGRAPGDTNGDGTVDFLDLNAVLSDYGLGGPTLAGDVNTDGVVDFLDLNLVLGQFGSGCAP